MKTLFNILVIIGLSACAQMSNSRHESSSSSQYLHIDVEEFTLDNGLRVLLVPRGDLPIFSYYTFYKVGSRNEKPGTTGASHFLEHMMFKGAKKYGPGQFDKIIEENGGRSNAYTSKDLTVYHESLPSDALPLIIDVEADRMGNLLLEEEAFETEREVVLNERKLRYENSPQGQLYYVLQKHFFEGTPYEESVIGKLEDLKTVTRDDFYQHFKKYYVPNNAVLVVVGKFDVGDAKSLIKEKYGVLKPNKELEQLKKTEVKDYTLGFKGAVKKGYKGQSPDPMFMMAYKGVPIGEKDSYYLDILSSLLSDGKSSLLQQKFVQSRNPYVSYVYTGNYNLAHSGFFMVGGQLLKGKGINSFRKRLFQKVKRVCDKEITERDLQKVRNSYLVSLYSRLKKNSGVAEFLGNREIFLGDYKMYKKEIEYYESATVEDIQRVCREYLKPERSMFITIWEKHGRRVKM